MLRTWNESNKRNPDRSVQTFDLLTETFLNSIASLRDFFHPLLQNIAVMVKSQLMFQCEKQIVCKRV